MKNIIIALLAIFFIPSMLFAAGSSCTASAAKTESAWSKTSFSTVTFSWTSDDSTGAVSYTTDANITDFMKGKAIMAVVTDPGSTAPSDNWDLVISDEWGADIMDGQQDDLLDRDTSTSKRTNFSIPVEITGAISLAITNAGNSKTGSVVLVLMEF